MIHCRWLLIEVCCNFKLSFHAFGDSLLPLCVLIKISWFAMASQYNNLDFQTSHRNPVQVRFVPLKSIESAWSFTVILSNSMMCYVNYFGYLRFTLPVLEFLCVHQLICEVHGLSTNSFWNCVSLNQSTSHVVSHCIWRCCSYQIHWIHSFTKLLFYID